MFLLVNPVEYHGPHLSLHNDHLISLGLVREVHARLSARRAEHPLIVAADLEVGVDPVPGPGTRAISYAQVRALVVRACLALAELGARRVVLMTFHGSPLHNAALHAGVRALARRGIPALAPLNEILQQQIDFDDALRAQFVPAVAHLASEAERAAVLSEIPFDFHAGFLETSLSLHFAPESVSPDYLRLPPCPAPRPSAAVLALGGLFRRLGLERLARELHFAAHGLGWYALRPFPGYTGRPALARAEVGALFAAAIADRMAARAEAVLFNNAPPPLPVMHYLRWLSLGGRVSQAGIPLEQIGLPVSRAPDPARSSSPAPSP